MIYLISRLSLQARSRAEAPSTTHSCPKHVVIGKKIPSQSNDKFVNYSQQRTIFHWNWKEILRFVGFITWLTQPIQPKLVEISVGVPPALQQTSIFLFSFNEKWLYGDYILWIYFQNCWEFFFMSIQARGSCVLFNNLRKITA